MVRGSSSDASITQNGDQGGAARTVCSAGSAQTSAVPSRYAQQLFSEVKNPFRWGVKLFEQNSRGMSMSPLSAKVGVVDKITTPALEKTLKPQPWRSVFTPACQFKWSKSAVCSWKLLTFRPWCKKKKQNKKNRLPSNTFRCFPAHLPTHLLCSRYFLLQTPAGFSCCFCSPPWFKEKRTTAGKENGPHFIWFVFFD